MYTVKTYTNKRIESKSRSHCTKQLQFHDDIRTIDIVISFKSLFNSLFDNIIIFSL